MRSQEGKRAAAVKALVERGWKAEKPALIGFGTNGFVTMLDGNHRLAGLLFQGLLKQVPYIPTRVYYFDVGEVINPLDPDAVRWDGSNLGFVCFPRGACGECWSCRNTLPVVRQKLGEAGIS